MATTWWSVVACWKTVTSVPVLQVAADGRWEAARPIPVTADLTRLVACVDQATSIAQHDVAVEVLWPGQVFVGARWSLAEYRGAVAAAAQAGAQRAQAAMAKPVANPVETALFALLESTPDPSPESAELGAVNAWTSVGPLTLWRRNGTFTPETLEAALTCRPDLTRCAYPVALEFAAMEPLPSWIGAVLSTRSGSLHLLDRDGVGELLTRATSASL